MPRKRFQREPCDCRECIDPDFTLANISGEHLAALQHPPPKSIIIFGDGALLAYPTAAGNKHGDKKDVPVEPCIADSSRNKTSLDDASHPHLDGLARDGCSGLLSVQQLPAVAAEGSLRPLRHLDTLAQLFGLDAAARGDINSPAGISKRFKEMTSSFVSLEEEALPAAARAGFQTVQSLAAFVAGRRGATAALSDLPLPATVAAAAAAALGLHNDDNSTALAASDTLRKTAGAAADDAAAADDDEDEEHGVLDLLFIHVAPPQGDSISQAPESGSVEAYDEAVARIEWIDALIRHLNTVPWAVSRLVVTVIIGSHRSPLPGPLLEGGSGTRHDKKACSRGTSTAGLCPFRPRQSWQTAADESILTDVHAPLLMVQRLPAVIRVDKCTRFDLHECRSCGGGGAILAQRMLHEVAYKLGRAPKYGA